jgi:farnesyl-diphosphate farnesyltransferase
MVNTYRVAGCVGEFWTKICRVHLFPERAAGREAIHRGRHPVRQRFATSEYLARLAHRLEKWPRYLPLEKLESAKLLPETLLSPANEQKFLPLFHEHLNQAESHLAAGWRYTNTLPFRQFRVRLACAWPISYRREDAGKLRAADASELQQRVKVSRGAVRGNHSSVAGGEPAPGAWRKLYSVAGKAVDSSGKLA